MQRPDALPTQMQQRQPRSPVYMLDTLTHPPLFFPVRLCLVLSLAPHARPFHPLSLAHLHHTHTNTHTHTHTHTHTPAKPPDLVVAALLDFHLDFRHFSIHPTAHLHSFLQPSSRPSAPRRAAAREVHVIESCVEAITFAFAQPPPPIRKRVSIRVSVPKL